MSYPNQVEDLLQRYLRQVGRRLPAAASSDVLQELDSLLRDQLDGRSEALGRPVDFAMAVEMLKAFGSPSETADRFNPRPMSLIGPATYPLFLKVARIVAGALVLAVFVIPGVAALMGGGAQPPGRLLLQLLGSLVSSLWGSLGVLVVVFAVLDRKGLGAKVEVGCEWDPIELPELPNRKEDQVSMGMALGEMLGPLFGLLCLWLLVTQPSWLRLPGPVGTWFQQFRFERFGLRLPMGWITGCMLAQAALGFALIRTGSWNLGLRWAKLLLGLLNAGILTWIALHAAAPTPDALADLLPLSAAGPVLVLVHLMVKLMPLFAIVPVIQQGWSLVRASKL